MPSPPPMRGSRVGGPSSLAVHLDLSSGKIALAGRLDGRTAHLLNDAISALLHSDRELQNWTVDVAGLSVADHAGLRAIGRAYRRALRHDRRITLHGASPALQSALVRLHLERHVLDGNGPPTVGAPTAS
jgi:anti-anti-sigma factor